MKKCKFYLHDSSTLINWLTNGYGTLGYMNRVLIFSQEYPPYSWGGVTPFTVNLVNGIRALGVDVQLITIGEKEENHVQSNGVKVCRIQSRGIYQDELIETSEGLKRHFFFMKRAQKLYQSILTPEAIILADSLCFPEAKACANHFKVPLISMVNQIFADINHLWEGKLSSMIKLEQLYLKGSDHLVAEAST